VSNAEYDLKAFWLLLILQLQLQSKSMWTS